MKEFKKPEHRIIAVEAVRDFQIDQYGLRTIVRLQGQPIKFEVKGASNFKVISTMI